MKIPVTVNLTEHFHYTGVVEMTPEEYNACVIALETGGPQGTAVRDQLSQMVDGDWSCLCSTTVESLEIPPVMDPVDDLTDAADPESGDEDADPESEEADANFEIFPTMPPEANQ